MSTSKDNFRSSLIAGVVIHQSKNILKIKDVWTQKHVVIYADKSECYKLGDILVIDKDRQLVVEKLTNYSFDSSKVFLGKR
ncbi:hypothetical protein IGI39_004455 [Enterococcus sp. AZ135]|uniref:hypothetical protein n=1 Tax=unclassified Enterococcus TaxID=2608891 RepID=UPI003F2403D2